MKIRHFLAHTVSLGILVSYGWNFSEKQWYEFHTYVIGMAIILQTTIALEIWRKASYSQSTVVWSIAGLATIILALTNNSELVKFGNFVFAIPALGLIRRVEKFSMKLWISDRATAETDTRLMGALMIAIAIIGSASSLMLLGIQYWSTIIWGALIAYFGYGLYHSKID